MSRSTSGSRRSGLSRGGEVWPAGERGGRDLGGAGAARGPEVGPGDPRDEQREKRAIRTPRVHGPSLPPVASARLPGLQAAASRKFSSFGAGPGPPGNPFQCVCAETWAPRAFGVPASCVPCFLLVIQWEWGVGADVQSTGSEVLRVGFESLCRHFRALGARAGELKSRGLGLQVSHVGYSHQSSRGYRGNLKAFAEIVRRRH